MFYTCVKKGTYRFGFTRVSKKVDVGSVFTRVRKGDIDLVLNKSQKGRRRFDFSRKLERET